MGSSDEDLGPKARFKEWEEKTPRKVGQFISGFIIGIAFTVGIPTIGQTLFGTGGFLAGFILGVFLLWKLASRSHANAGQEF